MTRAQRFVLLAAVTVAALMLLFPPWESLGGHYLGHAFITSPPGYEAPRPEGLGWALPEPEPLGRVSVSLFTLQLAVLWISAGAAFLFLGRSGQARPGGPE
jgi:hypothetical protein